MKSPTLLLVHAAAGCVITGKQLLLEDFTRRVQKKDKLNRDGERNDKKGSYFWVM